MIQSFRQTALKRLHQTGSRRCIRTDLIPKIERILSILELATDPQAVNLPVTPYTL